MISLTTKQKLILINIFSVFVIIIFTIDIAYESFKQYNNSKKTENIITQSVQLSNLLHQLQIERSASSGYITSVDTKYFSILQNKYTETNTRIKKVKKFYKKEIYLLDSLQEMRLLVEGKHVTKQEVFTFYTSLSKNVVERISDLALILQDLTVRNSFANLVTFIKAKEHVSKERTLLTSVFAKNEFTLEQYVALSTLVQMQERLFTEFKDATTDELKVNYEMLRNNTSFIDVTKMRGIALFKYEDIGIDSMLWFKTISKKLDLLQGFENTVSDTILTLTSAQSQSAINKFILIIILATVLLVFTWFVSYRVAKDIAISYNRLEDTFNLLGENVILSESDLKGFITFSSNALCKISGYTTEELQGQPHNILRHKDMEKNVFASLWETISSGETWRGEIKNKRKNGSFYWVETMVTPKYSIAGDIIGYISIRQDITDKKLVEEISIRDGLTNLYNRRHFNNTFPQTINVAKRNESLLCFLMLDIDFFKPYNDTYGHQKGDEVLIEVANTIKATIKRVGDFAFRLGGEEFGVIYQVKSREDAINIANTLKTNIQDLRISHEKSLDHKVVTASIGLICTKPDKHSNEDSIYKQADDLLYQAKASGRNKLVCYETNEKENT